MTSKKFKVAGVSKGNKFGYKVRFANDMTRVKILAKTDSDINLIELPKEMTKPELVAFLKMSDLYKNPNYKEAIDNADVKYNGDGVVKTTKTKAKAKAKVKPNMEAIKARAVAKPAGTKPRPAIKKPEATDAEVDKILAAAGLDK